MSSISIYSIEDVLYTLKRTGMTVNAECFVSELTGMSEDKIWELLLNIPDENKPK